MWDLIVIGGGAAGLWGAAVAASRSLRVLVLEKNSKSGVKILMSGGTRCNITHNCDVNGILTAFGQQGRFLKPAVHQLPPEAVVKRFHELGVPTKVEDSGKVFPESDRALDVRDALVRQLESVGAELRTGVAVTDVRPVELPDREKVANRSQWAIQTDTETLHSRYVLLCTGGLSYPGCGTTGDGYAWAKGVGHTIEATYPALAPLVSPANWVHQLKGITLPDVAVRVVTEGKKNKDPRLASRGGFLWTHFGCSGPAPMNVSRFVAQADRAHKPALLIDFLPDMSESDLLHFFDPAGNGSKAVATIVHDWLPRNMAACVLEHSEVREGVVVAELPRKSRLALLENLKRLCVPLDGTRGYLKAEVTAGGVCTKEVNPQTMESRLAPGLYLAGEILDVDGPIGGYNFQAAFATANLAALHMPPLGPAGS